MGLNVHDRLVANEVADLDGVFVAPVRLSDLEGAKDAARSSSNVGGVIQTKRAAVSVPAMRRIACKFCVPSHPG
jgi:hypothetical protein